MGTRSTLAFGFAASAFAVSLSAGAQDQVCYKQALVVDATPVNTQLCAPTDVVGQDGVIHVPVSETLSTKTASFQRTVDLEFLAGNEVSRSIDDVPLARLGFGKEALHLTIARTPQSIVLEHALLLPGAIPLK
jgi:hypothetical protein